MKKYIGELTSYKIDELSDEAKRNAYNLWNGDSDFWCFYGDDNENTLKEFCRIFDVRMSRWDYDKYRYDFRFEVAVDDEQNELSGIRLAKFVWNNYGDCIRQGKYYSKCTRDDNGKFFYKSRRSKTIFSYDDCPLTGYCMDCSILDPIIACLFYKESYENYEALIEACLNSFFKNCVADAAYQLSYENFVDMSHANDYEYNEDGTAFYLPKSFREIA